MIIKLFTMFIHAVNRFKLEPGHWLHQSGFVNNMKPSGNCKCINAWFFTYILFRYDDDFRDTCPSCYWWPGAHMALAHLQVTHCDCYQVIWKCCHGKLLCVWSSDVCCTCMCFQFHHRGSSHIPTPMATNLNPLEVAQQSWGQSKT